MVGSVVGNGRYVLRQKTAHNASAVSYAAHDLVGGIDVTLDLHPDVQEDSGFRLSQPVALGPQDDLPNLYGMDFTSEHPSDPTSPALHARSFAVRMWRRLRSAFRRGDK
jgi:hypothetical protein